MRKSQLSLFLISVATLSGCDFGLGGNKSDAGGAAASTSVRGVLSALRPKVDPAMVQKVMQEDDAARRAQATAAAQQAAREGGYQNGIAGRYLPVVSTDPIAPAAEEIAKNAPSFTSANDQSMSNSAGSSPQQVASYAPSYQPTYGGGSSVPPPPPGAYGGGSLVPPPPAVTLSTQVGMGSMPAYDPGPYASGMNSYQIPYQPQQQMAMTRPSGSFFGGGGGGGARNSGDDDDDRGVERRKAQNFVPITPTGMEPRSAFKQSDDLKVLWTGALNTPAMQEVMSDKRLAADVSKVKVGLPGEASKGAFSVNPRVVDSIFKGPAIDRRVAPTVKKVQMDVAQAYYRYLHTYNRFALAEQTQAARKQQVDMAGSPSEQQRAAADMSQSQNDVDSAREDMRAAQNELASVVGPTAARSVIGKVSGVSPSLDSLASAQPAEQSSHRSLMPSLPGFNLNMFHFGGGHKDNNEPAPPAAAEAAKVDNKLAPQKKDKDKKKELAKTNKPREKAGDLSPAPASSEQSSQTASSEAPAAPSPSPSSSSNSSGTVAGLSLSLDGVNVLARKSILTVIIRNSGANNYSFSPDAISISEGNRRLPEASVRTDFDQTMVSPNSEVKGTITIFGRPWNDKLAVVLSDGGKTIPLRR